MTRELTTVVKICENGKLRLKKKSDIAPGWPKAGGGERFYKLNERNKMENHNFCETSCRAWKNHLALNLHWLFLEDSQYNNNTKTYLSFHVNDFCSECVWYGEILCDGAVVEDLYRWWFLSKCSKGRMSVTSRSWSEVTSDPRYQNRHNNNNNNRLWSRKFIRFLLIIIWSDWCWIFMFVKTKNTHQKHSRTQSFHKTKWSTISKVMMSLKQT